MKFKNKKHSIHKKKIAKNKIGRRCNNANLLSLGACSANSVVTKSLACFERSLLP